MFHWIRVGTPRNGPKWLLCLPGIKSTMMTFRKGASHPLGFLWGAVLTLTCVTSSSPPLFHRDCFWRQMASDVVDGNFISAIAELANASEISRFKNARSGLLAGTVESTLGGSVPCTTALRFNQRIASFLLPHWHLYVSHHVSSVPLHCPLFFPLRPPWRHPSPISRKRFRKRFPVRAYHLAKKTPGSRLASLGPETSWMQTTEFQRYWVWLQPPHSLAGPEGGGRSGQWSGNYLRRLT